MKAIRTAALGAALVLGVAVTASAQGGAAQQGQPGRGRPNMLMVGIDSTLTPEQKTKIEEINKKYAPEQQAIRDAMQAGGDRAEGMKKMTDLRAKMQPEIRAVLTPAQQAIFDKNVEEMAKRAAAPRPGSL